MSFDTLSIDRARATTTHPEAEGHRLRGRLDGIVSACRSRKTNCRPVADNPPTVPACGPFA
jgi:hypothetical protein